ncbi:hypothetical protein J4Q44_G00180940 [Coregonus suidteri]|uniref:Uncharacterized protein n=1 Tax=Coregonus suidteri TaxID=861788 RepID=A0AAN8LUD8_9TELE
MNITLYCLCLSRAPQSPSQGENRQYVFTNTKTLPLSRLLRTGTSRRESGKQIHTGEETVPPGTLRCEGNYVCSGEVGGGETDTGDERGARDNIIFHAKFSIKQCLQDDTRMYQV